MSDEKVPSVCRLLRTKSGFGAVVGGEGWKRGTDETEVFWCLNTMESFGPDDGFVHAQQCCQGRSCWQRPDEDESPDVA